MTLGRGVTKQSQPTLPVWRTASAVDQHLTGCCGCVSLPLFRSSQITAARQCGVGADRDACRHAQAEFEEGARITPMCRFQ